MQWEHICLLAIHPQMDSLHLPPRHCHQMAKSNSTQNAWNFINAKGHEENKQHLCSWMEKQSHRKSSSICFHHLILWAVASLMWLTAMKAIMYRRNTWKPKPPMTDEIKTPQNYQQDKVFVSDYFCWTYYVLRCKLFYWKCKFFLM